MAAISEILARELGCAQAYVENIITLLDEGNTIPFIARYRKEQHRLHWTTQALAKARRSPDVSAQSRPAPGRRSKKPSTDQGKLTPELYRRH